MALVTFESGREEGETEKPYGLLCTKALGSFTRVVGGVFVPRGPASLRSIP
jgi:hypothetical protein